MEILLKMMALWSYIYMRKVLEEKDYMKRPWKNGRGITNEIMVWPPGEENFVWRLSQATLGESGPFSIFPGIERWLVLLEGNSITLKHSDREHKLGLMTPYSFQGSEETWAEVTGPGSDFNLMLRQGKASGKITIGQTGSVKVSSQQYGLFSTTPFKVDGKEIRENSFYYIEDEKGTDVIVESTQSFLIIHIEGTL